MVSFAARGGARGRCAQRACTGRCACTAITTPRPASNDTTDFIFAVLSEEFGWLGVVLVLSLYLFVIGRCLWIAAGARDGYSRLVAGALGLAFCVYVIVNGGMIAGLLPVVGVPMPLLSYGGTSAGSFLSILR